MPNFGAQGEILHDDAEILEPTGEMG